MPNSDNDSCKHNDPTFFGLVISWRILPEIAPDLIPSSYVRQNACTVRVTIKYWQDVTGVWRLPVSDGRVKVDILREDLQQTVPTAPDSGSGERQS